MNKMNTEITIYQLTTHPLEKVLPKILEKVYGSGLRALVVADTTERMQTINAALWTYSPGAFLPHGMEGQKAYEPQENPIWISMEAKNKNDANVLILTNNQQIDDLSGYTRCVDIFDGNDMVALASAQQRCQAYQNQGHPVTYWKQTLNGNWDQIPV